MNKPKPYTYWIFCDESGNLATEADRYLIGSATGTLIIDSSCEAVTESAINAAPVPQARAGVEPLLDVAGLHEALS